MTKKLSKIQTLVKYAKPVSLGLLTVLTLLSIYLTPKLFQIKTQYALDQFQPLSSPLLVEDQNIQKIFNLNGDSPLIAALTIKKSGTWLTPKRIKYLSKISKEIQKIEGVDKCISLTTVDTAIPDQGSFYVGSITDLKLTSQERQQVLHNPLIVPHLLSSEGKNTALVIELKRLSFDQKQETLKKIESTLIKQDSFFSAKIGGPAAITMTMSQLVGKEVILCTLVSLLISIIFFFVLFKNIFVLLASGIIILYSNILGLGTLWLFDLKFTVLTSTLPPLITLTVVAISVQTFSRVAQFRNKILEKHKNIMNFYVISGVFGSSLLASLTTAIGFATLMTSDTPIMRDYGLSVSIAILVASCSSLLLLSSLLVWMKTPHKRKLRFPVQKVFSYFYIFKKPFLVAISLACVVLTLFGTKLNWSSRLFEDLPENEKTVQNTKSIEKTFGGMLPLELMLSSLDNNFWKSHVNISKLNKLKNEFLKEDDVGSVIALSDFFKLTSTKNTLPQSNEAVAENYFVYGMAQENPLEKFVTTDYKSTRIHLKLFDAPSDKNGQLTAGFVKRAQELFPDVRITKGGIAATVHPLNISLSRELILGAFTALLAIFVLLVGIFRSVRWSLVALIPNLLTPLSLIGLLGITNTPIKPSLAIVFAISLGISFDNTIYILNKLRKLLAQKGNVHRLPILSLMREELVPCLVSSSAIICGFSVFLFSSFSINKTFGMFMIFTLIVGLIGDLVLLPVLLHFAPGLLLKPISTEKLRNKLGVWTMKPITQRSFVFFAILFSIALLAQPAFAKPTNANNLLKQIANKNATPSEEAKIRMTIVEPDGSSKERMIVIKKKSKNDKKALVRLLSPKDLKGVGLLSVYKNESENQWLYLPSEKRSRRIVGSNSKGRFLDSEISFEDLRTSTYDHFNNVIKNDPLSKDKDVVLIESIAKKGDDTAYGKIKTWVNTKQSRLLKAEYYTPDGELLKVMTFNNYKKYNNVWRAQSVNVKNVQKNRSTRLDLEKLSTKNINDTEFSIDSLEEG